MKSFRQYNITKEEVANKLAIANTLLDKEMKLIQLKENNKDVTIPTGYFLDRRLGSHRANTYFADLHNMDNKQAIELVKELDTKYFCHYEIDGKRRNDKLYCFKLPKGIWKDDEGNPYFQDDILVKFKLRPNEENPDNLYLMSLHYPDNTKESWTYLYEH